jgi:hypothetical protein
LAKRHWALAENLKEGEGGRPEARGQKSEVGGWRKESREGQGGGKVESEKAETGGKAKAKG